MNENQDRIDQLQKKLDLLYSKQSAFIKELKGIKKEIQLLKGQELKEEQLHEDQARNDQIEHVETEPVGEFVKPIPADQTLSSVSSAESETTQDLHQKSLRLNRENNLIGGVCAGIGDYFNLNRIIVRFICILLVLFSPMISIFALVPVLYIALWIFLPKGSKNKITDLNQKKLQSASYNRGLTETAESSLSPVTDSHSKKTDLPEIGKNLEKFVGENLISVIGIAITVLGVGIGVRYSIENELISPLTRIILGYVSGLALLGFGIKLKSKYTDFSAVLVSGAIAILYFITYAAYSFYDLIPQLIAFGMMVIFTAFTVVAAIHYNRQIIAHIGLVGAYGVPFLLSDGSDNMNALFSYMSIINVGVLAISFWRYWKPLFYSAFGLTWLIYLLWFVADYTGDEYFFIALIYLFIFFAIFYATFLAYKLLKKENFVTQDIVLLLINSFIFYGVGFELLRRHDTGSELLGLFTLANGLVHFIVTVFIYKHKLADKKLFYLVSGLVLVFITLAVPVQLDGNWVTLLWAGQAALLFWIGRTKAVSFYEFLSYPLMALACLSLSHDWTNAYNHYNLENLESRITPILNINFLSALLFMAAFIFIHVINRKSRNHTHFVDEKGIPQIISIATSAVILVSLFFIFQLEIGNYFDQLYKDSLLSINVDGQKHPSIYNDFNLIKWKNLWIVNFTMLFVTILSFVNVKKIRNKALAFISLGLIAMAALVFLTQGLYVLTELRESYVEQSLSEYYSRGSNLIYVRYISIFLFALLMWVGYQIIQRKFIKRELKIAFELFLHISILCILSAELIHWMHLVGNEASDKLGLSILWGLYSLLLIVLGIFKKRKHLRIGAMVLFGITLVKLFFYDIAHLDTIAKTIVLVSLGVLLLLISFLYNKFKHSISDEEDLS